MSDNKESEKKQPDNTDNELSELLDSALADFSKAAETTKSEQPEEKVEEVSSNEAQWGDDFIRQAAAQFETNFASLLGGVEGGQDAVTTEQIQASFQRMAEAAQQALADPGINDTQSQDIAATISQTIQGLSQGAESVQNPFSENDIMSMFNNLSGAGAATGEQQNGFLPFMQGMMQSLLSKDVLYPSLKDILQQYPGWLQENDATLSAEDKERYLKQQELMQKVCDELELEAETDSAEVRKDRFNKVLSLMQTLQDYGQPPSAIVADVPNAPFDPQMNPEQCNLM